MKVILLNGSPREKGCTYTGLRIIAEQLRKTVWRARCSGWAIGR